jgi:nicotinamidase-related amidase
MTPQFLSVDLQNEFATPGGALYRPRSCVPFLQDTFFPFVRARGCTIAEIISDYRVAEPGSGTSSCVPGTWGYQSLVPADLRHGSVWVKAEPSPAWTRAGAGHVEHLPGEPYPAPEALGAWLCATVGPPTVHQEIIVVGLMFEICVLSTLQELKYRGYRAKVLVEGVDTYSGDGEQKQVLCETLFPFWGQAVTWAEVQRAQTSEHSRVQAER